MEAWIDSRLLREAVERYKSWRTRFNKLSAPPIRGLCFDEFPPQSNKDCPTNAYVQICSEYATQCADLLGISEDQSITNDHIQTMSQVIQVASRRSKPSTGWHNTPEKRRFSRVPKTPNSSRTLSGPKNQEIGRRSQAGTPVGRSMTLGLRQSRTIELSSPTIKPSVGPEQNSGVPGSRASKPSDELGPKQLPKRTSKVPKTPVRSSVTAPNQTVSGYNTSHKKQAVRLRKAEANVRAKPPTTEKTGGTYGGAKNTKELGSSPVLRGGNIFAPAKNKIQARLRPPVGACSGAELEETAPEPGAQERAVPRAFPPPQSCGHSEGNYPPDYKSERPAEREQGNAHAWVRDLDGNILRRPGPDGIDVRLSDFVEPEVGLDTAEKRGFGPIRVPVVWKDAPLPRSLRSGLTLSHDVLIPSWMSLVSYLYLFFCRAGI